MTSHTSLMTSLVKLKKFQAWKYWISLALEENELDTYISGEVPVPDGDKAKSLTPKELGQGQEDHCWFNHGSPYTISVWFLDQYIWRKEHKSKYDFEKTVEGCKNPEYRDHIVILYGGLSNQRTTCSSRIRSDDSHLEWYPGIMGFIHARNVC